MARNSNTRLLDFFAVAYYPLLSDSLFLPECCAVVAVVVAGRV